MRLDRLVEIVEFVRGRLEKLPPRERDFELRIGEDLSADGREVRITDGPLPCTAFAFVGIVLEKRRERAGLDVIDRPFGLLEKILHSIEVRFELDGE